MDVVAARWITHPDWVTPADSLTAPPVLQYAFELPDRSATARLDVSGVGAWVVHLNGVNVDDAALRPGMSEYELRVEAVGFDVTELVQAGTNVLTVELAEGPAHVRRSVGRYTKFVRRRRSPRAKVALNGTDVDGRSITIGSDDRWLASLGPTRLAHWYGGEEYDARREPPNWRTAIPPDAVPAVTVQDDWNPLRWERLAPPVRVVETRGDLELQPVADGVWMVDAGRNLAGRPLLRLSAAAPPGVRLELWPAEYLDDSSRVDQRSTGGPIFDGYITGGGDAHWSPRFSYHGFRYLELRANDADTGAVVTDADHWSSVTIERLMTDNLPVGGFRCHDPELVELHRLVDHAIQSNLFSVPTDCPHREKLGWLEQAHLVFRPVARSYDIEQHWSELITHMVDAQTESGLIPDIAPELVVFDFDPHDRDWPFNPEGFRDDVNWGSAILQVPLQLYRTYATLDPLRTAWPAARRYLHYLRSRAGDGLLDTGLGDWIAEDSSTPAALVAGYGHLRLLTAAVEAARLLDDAVAAADYAEQATGVAADLRAQHVRTEADQGRSRFGSGSQASLALLLHSNVLDADADRAAFAELRGRLAEDDEAITVGEIGLPALIDVLVDHDQDALLRRIALNPRHPSYRTMLDSGLTALAESWRGTASSMSANHFMLGYIDTWLLERVAGLRQAPDSVGWRTAVVHPHPVAQITAAGTDFLSPHGQYVVDWWIDGDHGAIEVTVPAGCTARVAPPLGYGSDSAEVIRLPEGCHTVGLVALDRR